MGDPMVSPDKGERLIRGLRPFAVAYKGKSKIVDLPGYYPEGEGDGVHVGDDMAVVDAALRELKEAVDGLPSPATIRRIRSKLKLTQRAAGEVFRVGPQCVRQIRARPCRAERPDGSAYGAARPASRTLS